MESDKDNIQVIVRVRPLNTREQTENSKSCLRFYDDNLEILILDCKPEPKNFSFDFVASEKISQLELFEAIGRPITLSALEGYNVCLFAYGQTGAGKTYTMQGILDIPEEKGLQPRVFDEIFASMNQMKKNCMDFLVKCSFIEVYNEQIIDLLSDSNNNLQIREDFKKGTYVEGLNEEIVSNTEEINKILRKGSLNRHISSTNMNNESSRSHALFSMIIESKKFYNGVTNIRESKIHFVDLAGSERQKQTMAFGERLKEANNINKSLTVLGQVINSLVENSQGKSRHIPYRDSKLTFLLKDSLGGNSKTIMIAAISSASNAFCETLSTLKFAQRAKMIKNKALVNEESSGNVEMLKKEMKRLKDELLSATNCINDLKQNNIDIRDSFFMETAKLTPNYEIMFEKTNRLMINSRCKILSASKYIFEKEKLLEIEASFKENFKELNQNFDIIQENSINFEKEYKNLKETLLLCTKNEINYRMVIKLCHMRLERNNSFLNYCSNDSFLQEISNLKDENNRLHEILTNSMNINFVKDKNIRKKGKHKLRHHLNEIKQLFNNLERQVKKKKEFESLIQNSSYDESILVELKKKIDILNEENTKLKQNEGNLSELLENEKKKHEDLNKQEQKSKVLLKDVWNYDENISEVICKNHFQKTPEKILTSNDVDKSLIEQDLKIFELESLIEQLRRQLKYSEFKIESHISNLTSTNEEKKLLETKLNEILQNQFSDLNSIKNENDLIKQDLMLEKEKKLKMQEEIEKFQLEIFFFKECTKELERQRDKYANNLEMLKNERMIEQMNLEKALDQLKFENENIENDKKRIQEEMEILIQTYNFENHEINQIKENNKILKEKLIEFESEIQAYKKNESSKTEIIADLNFKNLELSKIIEGFNRKFDITTNDLEEKQKNQMEIYNKNLLNIKKVLSSTKSVIIHLKEEKERIHSEFKFLNDNYQALNCKYIQILKLNKELNHKIEIMNKNYKISECNLYSTNEKFEISELEKKKLVARFKDSLDENLKLMLDKKLLNEEFSLLKNEFNEINKLNASLLGHNNHEQKIKHISKLKEENNKLKDEKLKLTEKIEKLQAKIVEIIKETKGKDSKENFKKRDNESNDFLLQFFKTVLKILKNCSYFENFELIQEFYSKNIEDIDFNKYEAIFEFLEQFIKTYHVLKEEIQIAESKNKILLLECESLKKNKENNNINLDSDFLIKEESKIQNEETNTKKNFERKKEFPFETENPIKRMKFFN